MRSFIAIIWLYVLGFSQAYDAVCSSGIYAALRPLSRNSAAQAYCSDHYQPSTVTVTAATTLRKRAINERAAEPTRMDGDRQLLSSFYGQASAVVRTLCGCIQPQKTVTLYPTTTGKSTSTSRATTTSPCTASYSTATFTFTETTVVSGKTVTRTTTSTATAVFDPPCAFPTPP